MAYVRKQVRRNGRTRTVRVPLRFVPIDRDPETGLPHFPVPEPTRRKHSYTEGATDDAS